ATVLLVTGVSATKKSSDRASITLSESGQVELQPAMRAALPRSRSQLYAGVPDRKVQTSQFALMNYLSTFALVDVVVGEIGKGMSYVPAEAMQRLTANSFAELSKQAASGAIDQAKFREGIRKALSDAAKASVVPMEESPN